MVYLKIRDYPSFHIRIKFLYILVPLESEIFILAKNSAIQGEYEDVEKIMKILVTGIAGFIGFHVAKALCARGVTVIGVDNFNSYYNVDLKRARSAILKEMGVSIVDADISSQTLFEDLFQAHSFSTVIHLAAQAGVRYWMENPDSYMRSNVTGFYNLLEACKNRKDLRVIWASSSSVYGSNQKVPFSVQDRTDSPTNLYAATKKSNEVMAHAYHHIYQIPLIGLRFFTVYGPWGRPDMAYYRFTESIAQGKPIQLHHCGQMKRDFTYIDDIVQGVMGIVDSKISYGIYNLGNSTPVGLQEFVQTIERHLGKKAIIEHVPMLPGEIVETYADITESIRDFGFAPTVSLDIGIERFIHWWSNLHLG